MLRGVWSAVFFSIWACALHYKFVRLDPDMYYLRYVPVEIDPLAFVCLNVGVLVVAWLVLFIPARSAAKIDPTEIMRAD